MIYFSGFGFKNESELFDKYILKSDFTVAGFGYGATKAFEEAKRRKKRVDTLQLFSPAFFQNKDEKFIKVQLLNYKKDRKRYLDNFYKAAIYPLDIEIAKYQNESTFGELDELLHYKWEEDELKKLIQKGIKIEVFLGKLDKIVETKKAYYFFINFATVYWFNNSGHICIPYF